MKNLPIIYVAGKFRGPTAYAVRQNIRVAEEYSLRTWRAGMVALCPHMNTANFTGELPDECWLEGDLELILRCDAIFLLPHWKESNGAFAEYKFALDTDIPAFDQLGGLIKWRDSHNFDRLDTSKRAPHGQEEKNA